MISASAKRPELQGLRAYAVIAVFIYHFNEDWLPGGFLGVDAFFVLSGYLMAQVLSNQTELNFSAVLNFYRRRFNRVAPAALVVALVSIPLAVFTLLPYEFRDYAGALIGLVTLFMNLMIANQINYFSPLADVQPLLHYWSLMVELHFYLLIPFVFVLVKAERSRSFILVLLVAVSLLYAEYKLITDVNDAYYLLPSRAWELLIGSLFFVAFRNVKYSLASKFIYYLSILVFVGYVFFFDPSFSHPSYLGLPFILAVAFIVTYQGENVLKSLFIAKPIVLIGNLSFSIYLWHNLLLVSMRNAGFLDINFAFPILILATLIMSFITYHYVEQRFALIGGQNYSKKFFNVKVLYLVLIPLITTVGYFSFKSNGLEYFWKNWANEKSVVSYELYKAGMKFEEPDEKVFPCLKKVKTLNDLISQDAIQCKETFGKGILVIGDSHSMGVRRALFHEVVIGNTQAPFIFSLSKGSCKIYSHHEKCFFDELLIDPSRYVKNFSKLVYVQRGFDPAKLNSSTDALHRLSSFIDVIWVGPRVESGLYARDFIRLGCDAGLRMDSKTRERLLATNDLIKTISIDKDFRFIHAKEYDLDDYGNCDYLLWRDTDHWNKFGVERAAPILTKILLKEQSK